METPSFVKTALSCRARRSRTMPCAAGLLCKLKHLTPGPPGFTIHRCRCCSGYLHDICGLEDPLGSTEVKWLCGGGGRAPRFQATAAEEAPPALKRAAPEQKAPALNLCFQFVCLYCSCFFFFPQPRKCFLSTVDKNLRRAWTGSVSQDAQTAGSVLFCRVHCMIYCSTHCNTE